MVLAILEKLNAVDLGSARLVNKRLAVIGRQLLCRTVHVMETTESLERLMTISKQDKEITQSVKHMHYIALQCASPQFQSENQYRDWWYQVENRRPLQSDEEIALTYQKYEKFWTDTLSIRAEHRPIMYLLDIFRVLRPKSITISGTQNQNRMKHKLYKTLYDIPMPTHLPHLFKRRAAPCHWGGHDEMWYRPWLNGVRNQAIVDVLFAVEASQLALQSLSVSTGPAFVNSKFIEKLQKAFESIENLYFVLILDRKCMDADNRNVSLSFKFDDNGKFRLMKFLHQAKRLRYLWVTMVSSRYPRPLEFLKFGNLRWANLETLRITESICQKDDLIHIILLHAKTLRRLGLGNISLNYDGINEMLPSWIEVFEKLLQNIQNRVLNLNSFFLAGEFRRCVSYPTIIKKVDSDDDGYKWPSFCWKAAENSHKTSRTLAEALCEHMTARTEWVEKEENNKRLKAEVVGEFQALADSFDSL